MTNLVANAEQPPESITLATASHESKKRGQIHPQTNLDGNGGPGVLLSIRLQSATFLLSVRQQWKRLFGAVSQLPMT